MTEHRAADIDSRAKAKALEQELAEVGERLLACERRLERAQSSVYERDFELKSTRKELATAQRLLDTWRETAQQQERQLADGEARLIETELRVERLEGTLASLRGGHAYRLMRVIWRLRRPFRRGAAS